MMDEGRETLKLKTCALVALSKGNRPSVYEETP